MNREEAQRLRQIVDDVSVAADAATQVLVHRAAVLDAAGTAKRTIRQSAVDVRSASRLLWRTLPMSAATIDAFTALAHSLRLPDVSSAEQDALNTLAQPVTTALRDVRALFGLRRMFSSRDSKQAAEKAAGYLTQIRDWSLDPRIAALLRRVDDRTAPALPFDAARAVEPTIGLDSLLGISDPMLVPAESLRELPWALETIRHALVAEGQFRQSAMDAGTALRHAETERVIAEMPIDRLRDATRDRIRTSPLEAAGMRTVGDVLRQAARITQLPGIGDVTAQRIRGAAQTLWQAAYDEMPARIDVKSPRPETYALVKALSAWDAARTLKNARHDLESADALRGLAEALTAQPSHLVIGGADAAASELLPAANSVITRARSLSVGGAASAPHDAWQDFLARPADYFVMLQELGFLVEDEDAVTGGLPEEIIAAIRKLELDGTHLTASLRGYQSFAARFALVQRKVIIGDEMGLGKTVEAIAVLAHLRAKGSHHGLVVCPAAVVTNWMREVQSKSSLRAHRLHGPGRVAALRSWRTGGGVAVTTYESLGWLLPELEGNADIACVVFDEAHYIKNFAAQRARRSAELITATPRAILLTGTPLENRIGEFKTLVEYVRPDLVVDVSGLRPRLFRQQVAPAYLRRSQEDVLTELPELVQIEEWLPMSSADERAYREAVYDGNFQAMRQAAALDRRESEKLQHLAEIVAEAEENGRKVIVFSNFLRVLDEAKAALPGRVFGPITGRVPAAKRQQIVDEFSAARDGAVLVAQIAAGGVGLNIQAASVVVICEPQLKPTSEWQAIARARRMGQLQSVQVHRLLSEDGVDRRIWDILATKTALFEEFAALSETADAAPEALDVSEAELVRDVVDAERRRLFPGLQETPVPAVQDQSS
ncbi:DEAD/DEAH box helicase [uncultured Microbacterium sp.]|uniref:DEAD/DEAH box helicase n=1 Tax=uncultured Microbacterium sp. TaxID=191216 RepID=UPI0028DB6153|nr:DEAD/DEAH box helicase [uncultured Microbacterium sp.]